MAVLFSVKHDDSYCVATADASDGNPSPKNLLDAKKLCMAIPACTMFYDVKGNGDDFRLCSGKEIKSNSGSILYLKPIQGKGIQF